MSKPDWSDAPEWANWLAQSADTDWYWFENKPVATSFGWSYNPNFIAGRVRRASDPSDWQDTLEGKRREQKCTLTP